MNLQENIDRIKEIMGYCDEVTIYFAHPINTYGTDIEEMSVESIKTMFPNSKIINPGDKFYQDDFSEYKKANPNDYMKYFKGLVDKCSIIVYLPFRDNTIGAGVWYEIHNLHKRIDNIYKLNPNDFTIEKVTMEYVDKSKIDIEQTRKKIKQKY